MKNILLIFTLVAGWAISPVSGQTFDMVARQLASAGLQAKAAAAGIEGEKAAIKAEIAPADPEVEFEYMWPQTAGEENRWSVGISQELPDFRKMKAAGNVVTALDRVSEAQTAAIDADYLYNARMLLIRLVAARKEAALRRQIHESFDTLSVTYRKAWSRGEVSIIDVNKIGIEHARAKAGNLQADGELAAVLAEIIAQSNGTLTLEDLEMIDEYPVFEVEIPGAVGSCRLDGSSLEISAVDEAAIEDKIRQSAIYRALQSKIDLAGEKVNYASKNRFPQLTLGYAHEYEDFVHFNALVVGATLPVWSRKNDRLAATGEMLALQTDADQQFRELKSAVMADYAKAQTIKLQLDALGPAIESTDNIRLLNMALDGGELSLLNYLQEVTYFAEAAKEYNDAARAYAETLASLSRLNP